MIITYTFTIEEISFLNPRLQTKHNPKGITAILNGEPLSYPLVIQGQERVIIDNGELYSLIRYINGEGVIYLEGLPVSFCDLDEMRKTQILSCPISVSQNISSNPKEVYAFH